MNRKTWARVLVTVGFPLVWVYLFLDDWIGEPASPLQVALAQPGYPLQFGLGALFGFGLGSVLSRAFNAAPAEPDRRRRHQRTRVLQLTYAVVGLAILIAAREGYAPDMLSESAFTQALRVFVPMTWSMFIPFLLASTWGQWRRETDEDRS